MGQPVFSYMTVQGVNKALLAASKKAGVPYLSTHQIGRHTFAARMLGAGYAIKMVKEGGRWKSLKVVDRAYGHLEQRHVHDAMRKVADMLQLKVMPQRGWPKMLAYKRKRPFTLSWNGPSLGRKRPRRAA